MKANLILGIFMMFFLASCSQDTKNKQPADTDEKTIIDLPSPVTHTTFEGSETSERIETLNQLSAWLNQDFGAPSFTFDANNVIIQNGDENEGPYFRKNGGRKIYIRPIDFHPKKQSLIVHELFHALYEAEALYQKGRDVAEAWAAYAQYRFEYKDLKNSQIADKLLSRYGQGITQKTRGSFHERIILNPRNPEFVYAQNAYPLFARSHESNLRNFQKLNSASPIRFKSISPGATDKRVPQIRAALLRHRHMSNIFTLLSEKYDQSLVKIVKKFQAERKLAPDGIIGPKTWEALTK